MSKLLGNCSVIEDCILPSLDLVYPVVHDPEWREVRLRTVLFGSFIAIIGTTCSLCVCSYEKYGGDHQKRIITNRIFMQQFYNAIGISLFTNITLIVSLCYGPLPTTLVNVTYFFSKLFLATSSMIAANVMAILRILMMTVWKRVPPINEDFFARFFLLFDYTLGFCRAYWGILGHSSEDEMYFILTGLPLRNSDKPNLMFFTNTILTSVLIHVIYVIVLVTFKIQTWIRQNEAVNHLNPDSNQDNLSGSFRYNNMIGNKDITNFLVNFAVVSSLIFHVIMIGMEWEDNYIVPAILAFVAPAFATTFIMPVKTFLQYPEIWRHIKESFVGHY